MSEPKPVRVTSEVGRLRRVLVQPPGAALERMLPSNLSGSTGPDVLFDDLVHVPQAQREHDDLRALLGAFADVLIFEDLLAEVLEKPDVRSSLLERVAQLERLTDAQVARLEGLDGAALTASLLVGTIDGKLVGEELFAPVPNLIFTRDLAAVVGHIVVLGSASKRARQRESLLTWALMENHPALAGARISETSRNLCRRQRVAPLTVEGGDVLVVSSSLVCIGASERTSWSLIVQLADELLDEGFSRVLVVEMPKQRSSMHLDTVFTMTDWDGCVVYHPLLRPGDREQAATTRLRRVGGATVVEELEGDLLDAIAFEGHPLRPVFCGGRHPVHARREQWTDGANYVALGPGVVVGYARNVHTGRAMAEAGYVGHSTASFLKMLQRDFQGDADALIASGRRFAVHIEGSELSRGRGGPRCLTLPLLRD